MKTTEIKITKESRCFAVRGEVCIDDVNPETGLTYIYGKTLKEVQLTHPKAEEMSVDEYIRSVAEKQDSPWVWEDTTEESFDDMLNVLPPAARVPGYSAFLVGEPWDHHAVTGSPRFQGFMRDGSGGYFCTNRPIRFCEFKQWAEQTNRGPATYGYVS